MPLAQGQNMEHAQLSSSKSGNKSFKVLFPRSFVLVLSLREHINTAVQEKRGTKQLAQGQLMCILHGPGSLLLFPSEQF